MNTAAEKPHSQPIWLAALFAAHCSAEDGGPGHPIKWTCGSGRAIYTNAGASVERIEPLGVNLHRGQTVTVHWITGDTTYTVEVYARLEMCA